MSEKVAYKTLREKMARGLDRIDRVENAMLTGMPDVNYCIGGREGWIEIKYPTEPVRASTPLFGSSHKLSQEQMNWLLRQHQAGGTAYILIVTDKRWILVDKLYADVINKLTLGEILQNCLWESSKPVKGEEPWNSLRLALQQ